MRSPGPRVMREMDGDQSRVCRRERYCKKCRVGGATRHWTTSNCRADHSLTWNGCHSFSSFGRTVSVAGHPKTVRFWISRTETERIGIEDCKVRCVEEIRRRRGWRIELALPTEEHLSQCGVLASFEVD